MGKNRLFIPQETLDEWIESNRADVEANEMTLADDGHVYHLATAVLFLQEATGASDPHNLIGRVKEDAQLTILGADAYMDSVILEDNAYDVTRGFIAMPALDPTLEPSIQVSGFSTTAVDPNDIDVDAETRELLLPEGIENPRELAGADSQSREPDANVDTRDVTLTDTISDSALDGQLSAEPAPTTDVGRPPPSPIPVEVEGDSDAEDDELAKLLLRSLK